MNLKRTATIVVVGGAFGAWLYAAAMPGPRETPRRIVERPAAIDARGQALADEVARLHDRLRPDATPRQPGRNLFQFSAPAPRPTPPPAAPALSEAAPLLPVAPPPPPFKLIGVAEDAGPNGPIRTAIVSMPGQLYTVKEGENVTPRYKVAKIAATVVELVDQNDGSTLRLAMK
jgi:hypothetical protein